MTVWVSSDLHFHHKMVARTRGFATPEEHDSVLIATFNRLVKPDDVLWLLGDISMARNQVDILNTVACLTGRKQLVTGNHDAPFPGHRNSRRHQKAWLEVFESVQAFARTSICGEDFLLSHFPYAGDHTTQERYMEYRLRDYGKPLLHGHTHSSVKLTSKEHRVVHVGVDAWSLRPVKDTEIQELLAGTTQPQPVLHRLPGPSFTDFSHCPPCRSDP